MACIAGKDQVKILKIRCGYFSRFKRIDVYAAFLGRCDRAPIGRFADVVAMRAGGIHMKLLCFIQLRKPLTQNAFRGR